MVSSDLLEKKKNKKINLYIKNTIFSGPTCALEGQDALIKALVELRGSKDDPPGGVGEPSHLSVAPAVRVKLS